MYILPSRCCVSNNNESEDSKKKTPCNTLQHNSLVHGVSAQVTVGAIGHAATRCNALQHTATHCNALLCTLRRRSAGGNWSHRTHCNALQRTLQQHRSAHSVGTQLAIGAREYTTTHCNTRYNNIYCVRVSECRWQPEPQNTLQHSATHHTMLQCTVSSCNARCHVRCNNID